MPILTLLVLLRALNQPPQPVAVEQQPRPAPEAGRRDLGGGMRRPPREAPAEPPTGLPRNPTPLPGAHDPQEGEGAGPAGAEAPVESGKERSERTDPVGPSELPNGREVSLERLDRPRAEIDALVARARARIEGDEWFAPYLEVLENNQWATCHGYDVKNGRLHGPGMTLYRDGRPMIVANYKGGRLDGQLRVWDNRGQLLLYAEYTRGRQNGLVSLFDNNVPWLVLDVKPKGSGDEYLVVRIGSVLTVFDLARPNLPDEVRSEEAAARAELAALLEMLDELHQKRKPAVRAWFEQEREEFQRPLVTGRAHAYRAAQVQRNKRNAEAANAAIAGLIHEATKKRLPW